MIRRISRRTGHVAPRVSLRGEMTLWSANATYDSQRIIAIGFVNRVDTEKEEREVVDRREEWGNTERE